MRGPGLDRRDAGDQGDQGGAHGRPQAAEEELARVAFSNLRDYVEWTATSITLKASDGLSDEKAGAVAEVSRTQHGLRIRLHSKLEALHLLGKHLGLFNNRNENLNVDLEALSDSQLQRIIDGEDVFSVLAHPG